MQMSSGSGNLYSILT
jgi:heat shock protein 90kDa beta